MAYRVVIEPEMVPDLSWLEQSSYDPASPDFEPVYDTGGEQIDPDHYRDPANHAMRWIALFYADDGAEIGNAHSIDSIGNVDYYPADTAPEGVWDVDGPADLPAEWDDHTREIVADFDWSVLVTRQEHRDAATEAMRVATERGYGLLKVSPKRYVIVVPTGPVASCSDGGQWVGHQDYKAITRPMPLEAARPILAGLSAAAKESDRAYNLAILSIADRYSS